MVTTFEEMTGLQQALERADQTYQHFPLITKLIEQVGRLVHSLNRRRTLSFTLFLPLYLSPSLPLFSLLALLSRLLRAPGKLKVRDFVYDNADNSSTQTIQSAESIESVVKKVMADFETKVFDHPWNNVSSIPIDCI